MNLEETLSSYINQINDDLQIDEMNIKDVQMRLPSKRHFWVARLIKHKIDLDKLKTTRANRRKELIKTLNDNSPVKLAAHNLERSVDSLDEIQKINSNIRITELIIELLEKTEKNFSSCTYDISNIVKIIQLEQQ